MGKQRLPLLEVIVILQNSVRPRTEFLIGAASAVIWASFWYFALAGEKERRQTLIVKLLVSIPLSRNYRIQYVSCIRIGTKKSNFYSGFWKGFTCRVANWLLEKPDISGVGSYERNNDGKASSLVVVFVHFKALFTIKWNRYLRSD